MMIDTQQTILITDLDNTVYDFVHVHATAFRTLLHIVSKAIEVGEPELKSECKRIATGYGSLDLQDYVFDLVLHSPKILERGEDFLKKLENDVRVGFDRTRLKYLVPYEGISETFRRLSNGGVKIIGLSNAPFVISYYRLGRLGLRQYLSGLVAWEGPLFSHDHPNRNRRIEQRTRFSRSFSSGFFRDGLLLRDELKPSMAGFKVILNRFGDNARYFTLGDSISKDLAPATNLGMTTVWARYGTLLDEKSLKTLLEVTPWTAEEIANHNQINIKPDYVIDNPLDLINIIPHHYQPNLFELYETEK